MSNWKRGLPLGSNSAPSEKRRGTWHAPRPQKWARIATKPVWFQPEDFRRVPVSAIGLTAPHLRRLHTSGLPGPRSCDKRTIHQNLRLISPFSKTMPGVLSADLLPQGRGLLQAALSSQVNRPHHLEREAQSDGVLIVAPFPAVHHLSPHGDLIEHRSDFREFPRLPGMIADDTCAVRAHIIRVGQLGSVTVLRPGQVHNHCDRQPFFHFVAKVVEDFRNTPVSAGAFGYRARGLNPSALERELAPQR